MLFSEQIGTNPGISYASHGHGRGQKSTTGLYPGFTYRSTIAASVGAGQTIWTLLSTSLSRALQDLGSRCLSQRDQISTTHVSNFQTRLDTPARLDAYSAKNPVTCAISWRSSRNDMQNKRRLSEARNCGDSNARAVGGGEIRKTVETTRDDGIFARTALQSPDGSSTVLFDSLYGSEAGPKVGPWGACPGFEVEQKFGQIPERLHSEVEIQDGWIGPAMSAADTARLYCDCRPDGSIYDDPPKQAIQQTYEIPVIQPCWTTDNLSDASNVLWTYTCPAWLYEILGADPRLCESGSEDQSPDSTRRYNCSTSGPCDTCETISILGGPCDLPWFRHPQSQMSSVTVATAHMEWSSDRLRDDGTVSASQETTWRQPQRITAAGMGETGKKYLNASVRKRGWATTFMHDDGFIDTLTDTVSNQEDESPAYGTQVGGSQLGRYNSPTNTGGNDRTRMVGERAQKAQRKTDANTFARPDNSVGRIRHRGWAHNSKRFKDVCGSPIRRPLVVQSSRTTMAYHAQGAGGTAAWNPSAGQDSDVAGLAKTNKPSLAEQDRQQGGRFLRDKAGGKEIGADAHSESPMDVVHSTLNSASQRIHERRRHGSLWSRPTKQRALHTHGMENEKKLVSKTGQSLGTTHSGRLRLESKQTTSTLLLSMERGGSRGPGRSQTGPEGRKLVLQSSPCHDSISAQLDSQIRLRTLHTHNTSTSDVVHTHTAGNVSTASSADKRPPINATSGKGQTSKTAADVLGVYGLEALHEACISNGLTPLAADFVLSQWRLDKQLPLHCNTWKKYWIPYCAAHGINPVQYDEAGPDVISTSVHLTNCIAEAQTQAAEKSKQKGKAAQHSILKLIRAAVSAFMLIIHPEKPELTYTTYVRKAAKTARLVAPMAKRYSFCFDISVIFNVFCMWYEQGYRNDTMPMKMLRAKCMMLARIQTSGRSDDLTKIFRERATSARTKSYAGLLYNKIGHLQSWRYHRPKNVASLAGHSSGWVQLGSHKFETNEDTDKYCAVYCIEIYLNRTTDLPREPVYTEDGDGYFPVFIGFSKNKSKNYAAIGAQTIAKDILWVMKLAGIDTEQYKAHCVRHASLAAKRDHGMERDVFLASAKMSGAVYDRYYNVPILHEQYHTSEERQTHYARQYGLLSQVAIAD